jgi:hypothetical protein
MSVCVGCESVEIPAEAKSDYGEKGAEREPYGYDSEGFECAFHGVMVPRLSTTNSPSAFSVL